MGDQKSKGSGSDKIWKVDVIGQKRKAETIGRKFWCQWHREE